MPNKLIVAVAVLVVVVIITITQTLVRFSRSAQKYEAKICK